MNSSAHTAAMATDANGASLPLVVGLGPVPAEEVEPVLGAGIRFVPDPSHAELREAQGAIVRAAVKVGAAQLDEMPALRVLARTGVGVDDVDVAEAAGRGIPVSITPGTNTNAVAEGAFAHILHLVKSLRAFTDLVRGGGWAERVDIPVGDLEGAVLGIVGFGRIGRRVAHLAEAFGMTVRAYDPVAEVPEELRAGLQSVLQTSDVLSLHLRCSTARGASSTRRRSWV